MSPTNLRPLYDHLIVEPIEEESRTASGLVLPDTAKEKPQRGRVLAVGPGSRDKAGKRVPLEVAAGDIILFAKYSGSELKRSDQHVLILREVDVLAILES